MKVKTSTLIGPPLDWAVAKCEGVQQGVPFWKYHDYEFNPSTKWAQGGPLLEMERVKVFPNVGGTWSAQIRHTESHPLVSHPVLAGWTNSSGPTPLIAAMRCLVASRLGDEVEIPEEFCK